MAEGKWRNVANWQKILYLNPFLTTLKNDGQNPKPYSESILPTDSKNVLHKQMAEQFSIEVYVKLSWTHGGAAAAWTSTLYV